MRLFYILLANKHVASFIQAEKYLERILVLAAELHVACS